MQKNFRVKALAVHIELDMRTLERRFGEQFRTTIKYPLITPFLSNFLSSIGCDGGEKHKTTQPKQAGENTMNINKIICGLVFTAAILAITGCNSPPKAGQAIGEINGTISWDKGGERPDPSVINDAIGIAPVTVKLTPGGPGTLGSTTVTPIQGFNVLFGSPLDSGSRVTVAYTVSKLPLDTAIQLEVKPKRVQGLFARNGNPQDAVCTFAQPKVSQFDFHFVSAPR